MHTTEQLLARRANTIGPYSPLFYAEPIELVSAKGVWLTAADGTRYLDGYNNVPHVGHCNDRVVSAIAEQAARLNLHTRYLNTRVIDYSERLLATFEPRLDRVFYGNSGSEANELAIRIARQLTGNIGMIVSDFSYHGTTITLAGLTTGLKTAMPLDPHVRTLRIPDLDSDARPEAEVLAAALASLDESIASLQEAGYGVAASLFDSVFSTEGLPRLPEGFLVAVTERIKRAGGMVIADEVQSGFGRTGSHMWGYQYAGIEPDLVTLGKPMGNGHPMSAVVTSEAVQGAFGSTNEFFNTFAGNPVSAAAGEAVLIEMAERDLMAQAGRLGTLARARFDEFAARHDFVKSARGVGMFLGLEFAVDGSPAPDLAKRVVEAMKQRGVLISRIGRDDSVLKVRPPLAFGDAELPIMLNALDEALSGI